MPQHGQSVKRERVAEVEVEAEAEEEQAEAEAEDELAEARGLFMELSATPKNGRSFTAQQKHPAL